MSVIVELSLHDWNTAAFAGLRRHLLAMWGGSKEHAAPPDDPIDVEVIGAVAEYAVAKTLNLFWHPVKDRPTHDADVGGLVDVRSRRLPGTGGDLAVRVKDKEHRPVVLVHWDRRSPRRMRLVGWLYGHEAKARARDLADWSDLRKVWFVPPPYRPIEELVTLYERGAAAAPVAPIMVHDGVTIGLDDDLPV